MYIVFADKSQRDRELGARFLSAAGHEVELVPDAARCRAALERKLPDVLILDEALPGTTAGAIVQWVRGTQGTQRPYIILMTASSIISKQLYSALEAGADDVMHKPLTCEELTFRAEAITRLVQWVPKFSTTMSKVQDWSEGGNIVHLRAWTHMHEPFIQDMSEMLGQGFSLEEAEEPLKHALTASEIPLVMPGESAQVHVALGMDARSLQELALSVFGDGNTPQEALEDMLREIANTLGGAFKRAAEVEGVTMTTGLPKTIPPDSFGAPSARAKRHQRLVSQDGLIKVAVEVELRESGLQRVKAGELREGMVLTRDLLNANGMMLVRSGTRLTSSNVSRISQLIPPHLVVEVAA